MCLSEVFYPTRFGAPETSRRRRSVVWCRLLVCSFVSLLGLSVVVQDAIAESSEPGSVGSGSINGDAKNLGLHAANAQGEAESCYLLPGEEGSAALARAERWAKSLTTFQASFIQSSFAPSLGANEQSGGTVLFQNPGKMRWRYQWPEQQDFIISGSEMRLYQPALNQLLIDSAELVLSSELPVAFLSGVATITQSFELKRVCREPLAVALKGVRLELTPKAPQSALRELALIVVPTTGRVVGASVIDQSENVTSFQFSKIIEGASVTGQQFTIEAPPGTDVLDNRNKKVAEE